MPRAGFELMIPMFEQSKSVSDRATPEAGRTCCFVLQCYRVQSSPYSTFSSVTQRVLPESLVIKPWFKNCVSRNWEITELWRKRDFLFQLHLLIFINFGYFGDIFRRNLSDLTLPYSSCVTFFSSNFLLRRIILCWCSYCHQHPQPYNC
jgi:hypothetical protein